MKKVLSIALAFALILTVFVFPSTAAENLTYCNVNDECLINVKLLDDGTVPTYKEVETSYGTEGLLIGIPTDAVLGDELFQPKDGYSIRYFDVNDNEISDPSAHIGTTDKVVVYNGASIETQYSLVAYGDADGDGVFDVIDATLAHLCLNGFMSSDDSASIYEALKVRDGADDEFVMADDYTQIVNDCFKDKDELEDNLKGRKFFLDDTIIFDTAVFAYDGKAKIPEYTADSNLKNIVTLSYNGNGTAPSAPGIYAVSATIGKDDRYIVNSGTKDIGFMVIAPDKGTGYTTKVDAANKKVIISVNNAYSDFTAFNTSINNWCSENYSLKVNNKAVSAHADVLSALSPRSYNKYVDQSSKYSATPSSTLLGSYLPADSALYDDYNTERVIPVSLSKGDSTGSFSLVFSQDESVIRAAIKAFELKNVGDGRGQRIDNQSREVNCYGLKDATTGERIIRAVVKKHGSTSTRLQSTGLKSMMVGYEDALEFVATTQKGDYSNAGTPMSMYNSSNERYSSFSGIQGVLKAGSVITDFLKKLNMGTPTNTSSLVGKVGWARYHCSIPATGLRYGCEYKFDFKENLNNAPVHYKLDVKKVDGCTITTSPEQDKVYKSTTYYYEDFMAEGEPFSVSAKLASGYKLSVTDANGNPVAYDAYTDLYIMPASNVTVTAVKE